LAKLLLFSDTYILPTSIIGASKIWHNMYTVNLVLSGMIHNLQWIADIESFKTKKGRLISEPAFLIFLKN
jgi:hypothetical protein